MKPYKVKHQGCKNPLSIITKLLFFKIRASHLTLFIYNKYIYIYIILGMVYIAINFHLKARQVLHVKQ